MEVFFAGGAGFFLYGDNIDGSDCPWKGMGLNPYREGAKES